MTTLYRIGSNLSDAQADDALVAKVIRILDIYTSKKSERYLIKCSNCKMGVVIAKIGDLPRVKQVVGKGANLSNVLRTLIYGSGWLLESRSS